MTSNQPEPSVFPLHSCHASASSCDGHQTRAGCRVDQKEGGRPVSATQSGRAFQALRSNRNYFRFNKKSCAKYVQIRTFAINYISKNQHATHNGKISLDMLQTRITRALRQYTWSACTGRLSDKRIPCSAATWPGYPGIKCPRETPPCLFHVLRCYPSVRIFLDTASNSVMCVLINHTGYESVLKHPVPRVTSKAPPGPSNPLLSSPIHAAMKTSCGLPTS